MEFHDWFNKNKDELNLESCDYDKACKIFKAGQVYSAVGTIAYFYARNECKTVFKKELEKIQSMAGNPNASEACRLIIKEIQELNL